jgi:hypothetical protein
MIKMTQSSITASGRKVDSQSRTMVMRIFIESFALIAKTIENQWVQVSFEEETEMIAIILSVKYSESFLSPITKELGLE